MKTSRTTRLGIAISASLWIASSACAADGAVENVSVRAIAHFGFDQTSLAPDDQAAILADVGKMKGVTWQSVTATGYTDSIGNAGYNARLSSRRAQAVKSYLVGTGLDSALISTRGRAAAAPVADNSSGEGRAKNRRTEIEFQGVRAAAQPATR